MPKPKKVELMEEAVEVLETLPATPIVPVVSEKEHLLALYQELKDRRINSISDLENLIARA